MIPSDHFVRFYNEVFKYLDENNGLEDYYLEISRHQEHHCLKLFTEKGIQGMVEYWGVISKEENVKGSKSYSDTFLKGRNSCCPSLTKVMDNDAGACEKYCLHCPGWVMPLFTKCGFFCVYDLVDLKKPECSMNVFKYESDAREFKAQLLESGSRPEMIFDNLPG